MKVQANGIEIHYEIAGRGPWVTLSHSLACNLHMWDELMEALTGQYRVLRFDTRGHGASSSPAAAYTLDQMADDVHGLFAALDITQTHWVGLSMGGMIGLTYALKYPGVFQSVVLADTAGRHPEGTEKTWSDRKRAAQRWGMGALVDATLALWFTEPYRRSHPEVMERIGKHIGATPLAGFCGCCDALSRLDVLDRLKEIKCPALVIVGDQDTSTPPDMARAIHQNLPGSELLTIRSAAHFSNVEQPQQFNNAILGFLDRVAK